MAASDFFARWSKTAGSAPAAASPARASIGAQVADPAAGRVAGSLADRTGDAAPDANGQPAPLTAADADGLQAGAGIAAYMRGGVDESVRRLALKRLFADPHYNVMDGLDIYIDDYNSFTPMSAALVASLNHGKALLADLSDPVAGMQPVSSLVMGQAPAPATAQLASPGRGTDGPDASAQAAAVPDGDATIDVDQPADHLAEQSHSHATPVAAATESPPHVLPGL